MTAVLAIEGLVVELAGRRVLDGVDLRVEPGEVVGLIGPNGAGKTTLLRAVLGLIAPAAGRLTVGGRTPAQARGLVGYVPQRHQFAWDFPISVAESVMAARIPGMGWLRGPRDGDRAAVERALSRVALDDLRDRPLGELSGGERQRVLVARALALESRILLLDEPFSAVDVPTQELLTALLEELAGTGEQAILMATHDLPGAHATCSRLCLLNRRVVADGPPAELADPGLWLEAFGAAHGARWLKVAT